MYRPLQFRIIDVISIAIVNFGGSGKVYVISKRKHETPGAPVPGVFCYHFHARKALGWLRLT